MSWKTIVAPETVAIALHRPDVVVVDCRHRLNDPGFGQTAWLSSHVPGAVFCHLDREMADTRGGGVGRHPLPDAGQFCETLGKLGISRDSQVVTYDERDGSMAAARFWFLLRLIGHEKVAVLDGGFSRWTSQGMPTSNAPRRRAAQTYRGVFDTSRLIDSKGVLERLNSDGRAPGWLIDARSRERFTGAVEHIDRIAGHIPGAVNRPYTENLKPDGRFLTAIELAAGFRELAKDRDPSELVVMCGSGVTACHHLLAMERGGLHGAKLFADSWSGWITDPSRPVASDVA